MEKPTPSNDRENLLSLGIIVAMVAYGFFLRPELPARLATHFALDGTPNGYSSLLATLIVLPLINIALFFFFPLLIRLSPRGYALDQSRSVIPRLTLTMTLMLQTIQFGLLRMNLPGAHRPIDFYIGLSFPILLLGVGNVMGKTERNFFVGFRTPWALVSERNWTATHRFGGRLMVMAGIAGLALDIAGVPVPVIFGLTTLACLVPVGYSFWFYRRHEGAGAGA